MSKKLKLNEICDILNGYAFKSKKYVDKGIRVIRITNVQKGVIEDSEPKYYDISEINNLKNYMLKENDLLISLTGNVGRVALMSKELLPAGLNQRVGCLRIKEGRNVSIRYVYQYLNNNRFETDCINNSNGIAQKNLSTEWLKDYSIFIPDINVQNKIVDELEKIQEIIRIKKNQIKEFNELIKSQFVEMFGDIKDTKYKVMKLEELTNLITDGEHKKPNYTEYGKPFISVVNITTGDLKFDNCKFVSAEDSLKFQKRCKPERNDILYTKVGATYGRSAIVNTDREFSLYVSVCLIKPKSELINPIFLNYTMRQPYVKIQADKCIKGIGVPDLHLIEIKKFNIIVPPIELQNQFAEIVKQIDKQKFESEIELRKLQKNIFYKWGR